VLPEVFPNFWQKQELWSMMSLRRIAGEAKRGGILGGKAGLVHFMWEMEKKL
jgi:hypothetical protein